MDPSLAKILVVDDEPANTVLLEQLLQRWDYRNICVTNRGAEALDLCESAKPDLLMLDLHMPGVDGFEVLERLPENDADGVRLPVIVLTADASRSTKRQALAMGAHDLVTKPFDVDEVKIRIQHLLYSRRLEIEASNHRQQLESRVAERTEEVEAAHRETILRLAIAAEYRDDAVGDHIFRVARTTGLLAEKLGLPSVIVDLYRSAATLHDLGKIAVPDEILLKPGKLNPEEWETMCNHTVKGREMLDGSRSQILAAAADIAEMHHERWDGTGYPNGYAGEEISLAGRLVALADVFDALTHERPYKEAWSVEKAIEEIVSQSGRHFDPGLVEIFVKLDPDELTAPIEPTDRELLF